MFGESGTITEMLNAGVNGYILKNTGKQELLNAIEKVANGETFLSKDVSSELKKIPPSLIQKKYLYHYVKLKLLN